MRILLVLGIVASLTAFFTFGNGPGSVPPRWSYWDELVYRQYSFLDKFGALSPAQIDIFRPLIDQSLEYQRDEFRYEWCIKNVCDAKTWSRAKQQLNAWRDIPPPER